LALRPQTAPERVEAESKRTRQFFHFLTACPAFPLRSFPDIRPVLPRAAPAGAALEGQKPREILDIIALSRTLATFLRDAARDYGQLVDLPTRLLAFPALEDALNRCLESNGQLKDEASPELSSLRHRLRAVEEESERQLQRLLHAPELREVVAEHYVTVRNNRFVIPVRAGRHTRVPGVVQDRSGSGETVFLEPLFAVELNNRMLLTKKEEEAEEHRVLLWLTTLVRREGPQLESVFATLSKIDVLQAKVRLARQYHGSKPRWGGTAVRLRAARHPLLLASGKPVVPIDLLIPEGKSGLIISGPNTGGKTVALKTLGLLSLMVQSGFLLPVAEDSCLPIFRGIFADIGDPQSLEQSLSTFAAHMQNLADLLRDLLVPALVLFDEPGGGTDPGEGGHWRAGFSPISKPVE
jgi:DNA mismatch repair protein MutS2